MHQDFEKNLREKHGTRNTGLGLCSGTANRGDCKAGVKDTSKWY